MIKTQKISLNLTVAQSKGNISSNMGDEKVLMSVKNSRYYNLGRVGGVIWELIKKPISINSLIDTLISQYDVERAQCEEHVISFLEMLNGEGLIQIQ